MTALLTIALSGGVVHGVVRADSTLERIPYAVIEIRELDRRVAADGRGYYVVTDLPSGRWTLVASALGYRTHEVEVQVADGEATRQDFDLVVSPVRLEGVEVVAERRTTASVAAAGPPPVRVDGPMLSIVPGLAEADVFRALQTLPSVSAVSDFSSALYVRGGAADQNLLLLDGAPLFNPYHLGGVFAAFDPSTISTVDMLPGAFPASAGDRLSSVISLNTRDGGRDRVRGQGSIGLISSRVSVDGPLPSGRGSYLLSLRRTYVDLFTDAAYKLGLIEGTLPYAFTDGHVKITHDVGTLGSLSASLYVDREGVSVPDGMAEDDGTDAEFTWGSYAASVRYRQPFGGTLLGEFRTALSAFAGSFDLWKRRWTGPSSLAPGGPADGRETVRTLGTSTLIRDALVAADLTWYGRRHRIGAGVQVDGYLFEHDVGPEDHEFDDWVPPFRRTDCPTTLAAYVEDRWSLGDRLRVRGGLRVLHAGRRGTAWMPRLGVRWEPVSGVALNLGAGRYAQVLHTLRDEEAFAAGLMAYDLLGAVDPANGLPTAEDVVLGAEWRGADTEVRVEGYLKRMERLPLPPTPADPLEAPIFVIADRRAGRGYARGLEAIVRHRRGEAEFSLSYALAAAELEADGDRYPPRYERRHTLDLTATLPWGERGLLSARLAAATGQPYTPVVGVSTFIPAHPGSDVYLGDAYAPGRPQLLLGDHNAARLPGYFRLDVAARRSYEKRWFGANITLTPYLQIINVLNTRNVLFADPALFHRGRAEAVVEYLPQLPILPTFGIEWRF